VDQTTLKDVAVIFAVFGPAFIIFWRMAARFERKLDKHLEGQAQCRANLPLVYTTLQRFEAHETDIWHEFNSHSHNGNGKVVRG
jgi:hypothetical protein